MTIRVCVEVPTFTATVPPVDLNVHHILADGKPVDTPTRTETLRPGTEFNITIHSRLALIVRRGARERLPLDITHCDPEMPFGIELREFASSESGEVVELARHVLRPGDAIKVALERTDVLMIREIDWPTK